ncbi:MAG TPA: tetratricopeptide repeat protein [Acidobacteriaceae bacterium]|jgi:tetratricopeptide (TPR) repeat protein|nr:tetratricopeptide repeat protein [Acidobacteriaceae bacterium]
MGIVGAMLFLIAGRGVLRAQQAPLPPGTSSPDQSTVEAANPLADAENAIQAKNYTLAANRLDVYLSVHPSDARALFDRGYIEDAQGHADAAEEWYRKAIVADPKQFESRLALGLILAGKGDPAAKEQLQAATQLEPNPPNPEARAQAYRDLARLLLRSEPEAARDALVAALKLSPETPDDALMTAQIAEAAGNDSVAEEAYRRVLQSQPDSAEAASGLAHALIDQKRFADAQPVVETGLQRDPNNPALNAQLAAILNSEGKQAEALTVLEKLQGLEPNNRAVIQMVADAEAQGGNLDKASADYAELLAATPDNPDLLDAQGQILIRQKQYSQAIGVFRKAVAARPDDVDAWSGIAFAASELHEYQQELDALSTRSKYAPDNASTLFLWATAYDNLHQSKAAAEYYHRFLVAAQGKFPDQEWQAKHRLVTLHQ